MENITSLRYHSRTRAGFHMKHKSVDMQSKSRPLAEGCHVPYIGIQHNRAFRHNHTNFQPNGLKT
jgi:hypothetical protein